MPAALPILVLVPEINAPLFVIVMPPPLNAATPETRVSEAAEAVIPPEFVSVVAPDPASNEIPVAEPAPDVAESVAVLVTPIVSAPEADALMAVASALKLLVAVTCP